jgi:hypothetical protein
MIRYLKVTLKGQSNNELYCTLTSLRVHGQGMVSVMTNSLAGLVSNSTPPPSSSISDSTSTAAAVNGVCPSGKFYSDSKYPHVQSQEESRWDLKMYNQIRSDLLNFNGEHLDRMPHFIPWRDHKNSHMFA